MKYKTKRELTDLFLAFMLAKFRFIFKFLRMMPKTLRLIPFRHEQKIKCKKNIYYYKNIDLLSIKINYIISIDNAQQMKRFIVVWF